MPLSCRASSWVPLKPFLLSRSSVEQDNAWTETTAFHYHCSEELGEQLHLHAGDDATAAVWLDVDLQDERYLGIYGAHRALIERAVSRMDGHVEPDSVWGVTGWLRSLDLPHVVATALQPPLGVEPFTFVQKLSRSDLESRLANAQLAGLTEHIWAAVQKLRGQEASTAAALSAKFATEGEANFQMELGSLSTYFGGLEGLIGPPMMVNGSLQKSMQSEHCDRPESRVPFKTSNGMEGVNC